MSGNIFSSVLSSGNVTPGTYALLLFTALAAGLVIAWTFTYRAEHSKSFTIMLSMLPGIACTIVLMVSGSLGASVAVAGTFSLVRFRSAPGTAQEIGALLMATAAGLACGMGWPVLAGAFTVALCLMYLVLMSTRFGDPRHPALEKTLQITVPEDLEYAGVFEDVFAQYTASARLTKVKTTNLGSLNRLTYEITLRDTENTKAFIDALRCRNGNLEISLGERTGEQDRL